MAERITYLTTDQVTIVGDWNPVPTMTGAVILLHMMRETRLSWAPLQRSLAKVGLASLAIDLRGHGESIQGVEGAKLDYRTFTDENHLSSLNDVNEALDWVRKRGLENERIAVCGASFGANLALHLLVQTPSLPCAVLLSPGADYRGLRALEDVQDATYAQSLYVAASEEDSSSFADSKRLFDEAPVEKKIFVPYKGAGHGTAMFNYDHTLPDKIAEWISTIMRG